MEQSDLEEKINKKPKSHRQLAIFVTTLALIGIGLLAGGWNLIKGVSADTLASATATTSGTIANPPVPGEPAASATTNDLTGQFAFSAGWSMVSGLSLQNRDFTTFKNSGLILYSFNDPLYPNRDFTTMPAGANSTEQGAIPIAPLGYYVFNPGTAVVNLTLPISSTPLRPDPDNEIFARGWHLLYWPQAATTRADLLNNIKLTYADGTTETATQAMTQSEHKISSEIYVVVNENSITQDGTSKLLTDTTTETSLSRIPEKSYFWLYLRRTKQRVTSISIDVNPVTVSDQKLIDAWLTKNNFDNCGNAASATATATPTATATATTCQFDGSDLTADQIAAKYEFLVLKFPSRPWAS